MATLSKPYALTSRNYVAEQGMNISNFSETFKLFWQHSSVFALKNAIKLLRFQGFFTSKRAFDGYSG